MRRSWWFVIAGFFLVVGIWMWLGSAGKFTCIYGCHSPDGPGSDTSAIFIGQVVPLTGPMSVYGQGARRGAQLAIEKTNLSEPVIKRKVGLITEDGRGTAEASLVAARKLVEEGGVRALLIGPRTPLDAVAIPVAVDAVIPVISSAAHGGSPSGSEFRIGFPDSAQGHALASFAREELKAERAAVLQEADNAYSAGLAEAFARRFNEAGGTIVSRGSYAAGDTGFRAQLGAVRARLRGDGPIVLFVPGNSAEAARITRQAREMELGFFLMGGDGWHTSTLLEEGGEALNGAYFATHFTSERHAPPAEGFVEAYKTLYGREAEPDAAAALAYDAVMLLIDAMRRAGTDDPSALRDTLAGMDGFPGITGIIDFDARGNAAAKPVVIMRVANGQLSYVKTMGP